MRLIKLWCEPPQFDPITFEAGLNIIMAHPTQESRNTDSTNGVGKSTFAKAVDFCLLADASDIPFTGIKELGHLTLFLEFEVLGKRYTVKRSLAQPNKPVLVFPDGTAQEFKISSLRNEFTDLFLGRASAGKEHPSFRKVMNYLIRDEKEGYFNPFESFRKAKALDVNTMTLYLMDLDYTLPFQLDVLEQARKELEATAAALEATLQSEGYSAKVALLAQRAEVSKELAAREAELRDFRVLPEYRSLQAESAELAKRMQQLRNKNFLEHRRLVDYQKLLESEAVSANLDLAQQIYEDLNVNFRQLLRKSLQEIVDFQKSVAEAERRFTQREVRAINERIEARNQTIEELDARRSDITRKLAERGALDEYQRLSSLLDNLRERLASLDAYVRMFGSLEEKQAQLSKLKREEEKLRDDVRETLKASEQRVLDINMLFSAAFRAMYGHGAYISIEFPKKAFALKRTAEEGEEFESLGKNHASVFCYDVALLISNANREPYPHFLLHDGVFTGVDPRQVRNALEFVINRVTAPNLQYICTLNASEVSGPEDFERFVRRHLYDTGPEGRFFKVQF